MSEIIHQCPPTGSGLTPCCGKTPFELPRRDRISLDACHVTCNKPPLAEFVPEVDRTIYDTHDRLRAAWMRAPEGTVFLTVCGRCLRVVPDLICAFRDSNQFWDSLFGKNGEPGPDILCVDCFGHSFCYPFFELLVFADTLDNDQRASLEAAKPNHDCSMKNVFEARERFAYLIEEPDSWPNLEQP